MSERQQLPELLRPGLDLVFCGTAASSTSSRLGQYYAGPGNRFWSVLAETGLTPRQLDPSEFRSLLDFEIGLTDIVKDQAGVDLEIEFGDQGTLLEERLVPHAPRYLCFNGKRAAQEGLGVKKIGNAPARTRTWDPRLRRPMLYPPELRAQMGDSRLPLLEASLTTREGLPFAPMERSFLGAS